MSQKVGLPGVWSYGDINTKKVQRVQTIRRSYCYAVLVVAGVLNVPAFYEEALDHLASEGLRLIHDFNIWLLKHTQKKKPGKIALKAW